MTQVEVDQEASDGPIPSPATGRRHWGRVLAAGYILLIAMAAGYVTYRLLFAGPRSEFVGIIMIILGLPWARILGSSLPFHGSAGVGLVLVLSYAMNTLLLYLGGASMQRVFFRRR
jgi:hypothetical protein